MKVLDLFSGIGGFSLGLERAGMETVAFCECEPHAQAILKKHWPDVPIYDDVKELTYDRLQRDGIGSVDVICGGFPCQDISTAGRQAGINEGTRSGLWSECARLLGEVRPRWAIFENVTNLLNGQRGAWFKRVLWDISALGYDAEWHCIPASELGAHHHRDRVWIIAYPQCERQSGQGRLEYALDKKTDCYREASGLIDALQRGTLPYVCRRHDGISSGLHGIGGLTDGYKVGRKKYSGQDRLTRLGNAVVPQIPEIIGKAIIQAEVRG